MPRPKEVLKEELIQTIKKSLNNPNNIPPLRYNSIIAKISEIFNEIIQSGEDYVSILNDLTDHEDYRIAFNVAKLLLNHNPDKAFSRLKKIAEGKDKVYAQLASYYVKNFNIEGEFVFYIKDGIIKRSFGDKSELPTDNPALMAEIMTLLNDNSFNRVKNSIIKLFKNSILIYAQQKDEDEITVGASKLGGHPDWNWGYAWPGSKDHPCAFIAQFNLKELIPYDLEHILPHKGWTSSGFLYFFYNTENMSVGFNPNDVNYSAVWYCDINPKRREFPKNMNQISIFPSYQLSFSKRLTLPPIETNYIQDLHLNTIELRIYQQLLGTLDKYSPQGKPIGQLFGYGAIFEDNMKEICPITLNGYIPKPDSTRDINYQEKGLDYRYGILLEDATNWRLLLRMIFPNQIPDFLANQTSANSSLSKSYDTLYYWKRESEIRSHNFFENNWIFFIEQKHGKNDWNHYIQGLKKVKNTESDLIKGAPDPFDSFFNEFIENIDDKSFKTRVNSFIKNTIIIEPSKISVDDNHMPIGASKIGGAPDISEDFIWPRWNNDPMSFIAQFNMKETSKYDLDHLLPDKGMLYFFYDALEYTWGNLEENGSWKVIYRPEEATELKRSPFPIDLEKGGRFPCVILSFNSRKMLADSMNDIDKEESGLNDEDWTRYEDLESHLTEHLEHDEYGVRLLGYPDTLQNEMRWDCVCFSHGYDTDSEQYDDTENPKLNKEKKDWILLFQFGDIPAADIDWNRLSYYWIKKSDLKKRNFEKVWMITQCT